MDIASKTTNLVRGYPRYILLRPYNSEVTDCHKEQLLTCVAFDKGAME